MIDLTELQSKTYDNTIRLGYTVNKEATIDKMIDELQELKTAKRSPDIFKLKNISNIQDNKEFCKEYNKLVKDTDVCEASDLIKVILSYFEYMDQDSELCVMMKNRYNNHR